MRYIGHLSEDSAQRCARPQRLTLSLFFVLIFAKDLILFGHNLPASFWTPFACVWQDALVTILFFAFEVILIELSKRVFKIAGYSRVIVWSVYAATVLYTAINVAIARVLSTALTWPLLRATGGPLKDSIEAYLDLRNIGLILLVIGSAITLPVLLRRLQRPPQSAIAGFMITLILIGPTAAKRVDLSGLHRNAIVALITTAFPNTPANSQSADGRTSPFESVQIEDNSYLRGIAAGRNVVLVSLESTAAQYLRSYGAADDPTPNLTRISQQAILFENAYAAYPESIKGLFSVICSTYPAINTEAEQYEKIRPSSIAAELSQAGYRTGLFHSGRFAYLGMESVVRNRGYDTLEDAGDIGGDHNSSFGIDDPSTVRRILSWVDQTPKGQPVFITYLPIAGHHPYSVPEKGPFPDDNEMGRYKNALHYGDAALGALFQGFQDRGLNDNTLWIFFGDHGEAFNQHDGNIGHTLAIYEENIHVPMLIVAPGAIREQIRIKRPVSLIDIAPTILDLVGRTPPDQYQGESLIGSGASNSMSLFMTDYSLHLLGLRDGQWKFIYDLDSDRPKLFDLRHDPGENYELSSQYPQRVSVYRDQVLRWCGSQREQIGVR